MLVLDSFDSKLRGNITQEKQCITVDNNIFTEHMRDFILFIAVCLCFGRQARSSRPILISFDYLLTVFMFRMAANGIK